MKIVAVIQARLGSTRFPGKVFADLSGKPLIWHVIERIKFSKFINEIVLATTTNPIDNELAEWAQKNDIKCFRGSENNVLERFYFAAKKYDATVVVRITADDPFKDPKIIDSVITMLVNNNLQFAYNNNPPTFPEGLDTEVFLFSSLERAYKESNDDFEKEHVTQYFYRHPELFKQENIFNHTNLSYLRWTIDTEMDYKMVKKIYSELYLDGKIFYFQDIISFLNKHPEISKININVERSEMYKNLLK